MDRTEIGHQVNLDLPNLCRWREDGWRQNHLLIFFSCVFFFTSRDIAVAAVNSMSICSVGSAVVVLPMYALSDTCGNVASRCLDVCAV